MTKKNGTICTRDLETLPLPIRIHSRQLCPIPGSILRKVTSQLNEARLLLEPLSLEAPRSNEKPVEACLLGTIYWRGLCKVRLILNPEDRRGLGVDEQCRLNIPEIAETSAVGTLVTLHEGNRTQDSEGTTSSRTSTMVN